MTRARELLELLDAIHVGQSLKPAARARLVDGARAIVDATIQELEREAGRGLEPGELAALCDVLHTLCVEVEHALRERCWGRA